MENEVYEQLVKPRPYLWWWVSDKEKLSDEAVVEGVLANGEMEDIELLFHFFGRGPGQKDFSEPDQENQA